MRIIDLLILVESVLQVWQRGPEKQTRFLMKKSASKLFNVVLLIMTSKISNKYSQMRQGNCVWEKNWNNPLAHIGWLIAVSAYKSVIRDPSQKM